MGHRIGGVFGLREYPQFLDILREEAIGDMRELVTHRVTDQNNALALKLCNLCLVGW